MPNEVMFGTQLSIALASLTRHYNILEEDSAKEPHSANY